PARAIRAPAIRGRIGGAIGLAIARSIDGCIDGGWTAGQPIHDPGLDRIDLARLERARARGRHALVLVFGAEAGDIRRDVAKLGVAVQRLRALQLLEHHVRAPHGRVLARQGAVQGRTGLVHTGHDEVGLGAVVAVTGAEDAAEAEHLLLQAGRDRLRGRIAPGRAARSPAAARLHTRDGPRD